MHLRSMAFSFAAAALVAAAVPLQTNAATSDAAMIASAVSAAPHELAKDATVVAMTPGGKMRVVRKGTNGITCMPDNPSSPGADPMCLDKNAMEWAGAWMTHKTPPNKVGFMYMLAGGSDASNTNPYATKPSGGKTWITTGPHVMVVGPAAATMPGYATGAHPDTSKPYVMWAGTPYAHLMIPVK